MVTNQVEESDIRGRSKCGNPSCECQTTRGNVHCPLHGDKVASMSVHTVGEKVLIRCHSGCNTLKLFEHYRKLMPQRNIPFNKPLQPQGITLQQFSSSKNLSRDFLRSNHIKEIQRYNHPALEFPYMDENQAVLAMRYRLSVDGTRKFLWAQGSSAKDASLYGRWRINEAYQKGYIFLCEGESDCLSLWNSEQPAVGLPGVSIWQEQTIAKLLLDDRIKKVYAFIEPDIGGTKMINNIRTSAIKSKSEFIFADEFKDFSDMWIKGAETFHDNLEFAISNATSWFDYHKIESIMKHFQRNSEEWLREAERTNFTNTNQRGRRYARRNV